MRFHKLVDFKIQRLLKTLRSKTPLAASIYASYTPKFRIRLCNPVVAVILHCIQFHGCL
ncbi:unnamed protein product [Arabidopsis halleri]